MRAMRAALLGIALVACGRSKAADPPAVADPKPPELRLPPLARPLHNEVELTLDPASEDFNGTITTKLEILKPTSVLWLDGLEIEIERATLAIDGEQLVA